MTPILERLLCRIQGWLPQRALTALVYRLMRIRVRWIKNAQIRMISRLAGVNWDEAASANPADYPTFNAFFTRELKDQARPLDPASDAFLSPCDGRVSETGPIRDDRLFQAKGREFSLEALLAGQHDASRWRGGHFATIYLSPRDYHRVHMPVAGELRRMSYIPGRLFSVAPYTVRHVDNLFAVNERVICEFETELGPLALILVGAMLVNGIETTWAGEITSRPSRKPFSQDYGKGHIRLDKGQEMGRFNMGSTVILLTPDGALGGYEVSAGEAVQLGQKLAAIRPGTLAPRDHQS